MNQLALNISTVSADGIDPTKQLRGFQALHALCLREGIARLETHDGLRYFHNQQTGETTAAMPGVIIHQGRTTTTMTFANDAQAQPEALLETHAKQPNITQNMLGAFVGGKSQAWVSEELKDQ